EAGLKLHPVSRGCNWGYGDAAPPGPGQAVLDLSSMNRILEVNAELGYAVIEPGVSQGQLWQYLKDRGLPYTIDATGAGPGASFVGNTLDRGFGHTRYGDHFLTACGMEIVLGDGRILRTGFAHYDNARAQHVYPYGVGPFLDGLFAQSNLGIVTRLGVWLAPEPEAFCAFFFQSSDAEHGLAEMVERLAPLRRQGVITSAVHIANDLRLISARARYPWDRAGGRTPLPDDVRQAMARELGVSAWTGAGAIAGPAGVVAATRKLVKRALRGQRVMFFTDRRLAWLDRVGRGLGAVGRGEGLREQLAGLKGVYALLRGEPNGHALAGTLWRVRDARSREAVTDPLDRHAGLMWCSPVLPMTGEAAQQVRRIMEPVYAAHGFEAFSTYTMINERAMICVSNLYFDRREPDEAERARACYDELTTRLMDAGYPPYRTGPAGYGKLGRGSGWSYWDVVAQLKATLDPDGVISPGRYEPSCDAGVAAGATPTRAAHGLRAIESVGEHGLT
ncbi:MAG: FAD-binding protein, partial [Phycisphaeraceae bacterium]